LGSAKDTTDEATDALLIYEEAKRHNIKPTTFFYNVIISKLAKARKLENALQLFDEMQDLKVAANSITYGAIISACIRAGSESQAIRLFR
jgi:pentatricopeptide repeat protein